jgi:hypothetical protein
LTFESLDHVSFFAIAGALLMVAGLVMLHQRWLARGANGVGYLALGAISLAAYALIATTHERRIDKRREPREATLDPEERPTNWRRGIGKALLAIVLAGIASIGVGVALAIYLPMPPADRAVIGGLLVPILWGGGMAWTLCDPRLVRATIILLAVSALGYGVAFLPKVL